MPVIYFARKNDSPLRLTKAKFNGCVLLHTVTNGSSEMITNLSSSMVSILYNFQLMKFALNNGFISAAISFLRTLAFQIFVILVLPAILGIDGIWMAIVIAELLSLIVTAMFLVTQRKRYHYA